MKMQTLSVTEFDKRLRGGEPRRFVFDSSNQEADGFGDNARWREEFNVIRCMTNPNRISFVNESGSLTLENVRFVEIGDEKHVGEIYNIICSSLEGTSKDVSYLIIADKIYL